MKYIKIIKLKKIYNKKGNIIKYLNKNDTYFKKINEVYFTEILLNQTKGWVKHKKNYCFLSVIFGKVLFVFKDNLINKKNKKIIIDGKTPKLIIVPNKIWFFFKGLKKSLIINSLQSTHSINETTREDINF
jgi:hypothetical protein